MSEIETPLVVITEGTEEQPLDSSSVEVVVNSNAEVVVDNDEAADPKVPVEAKEKSDEKIAVSLVSEYDALISWVTQRLKLLGYSSESGENVLLSGGAVVDFVMGEGPKLIAVVRGKGIEGLCLYSDFRDDMTAFFLRSERAVLTKDNVDKSVQFGTIGGGASLSVSALERMMKGLVDKQVSHNSSLTDGARNELSGHYHRCMATLTDTMHCNDGKTVLYCPSFDATVSVSDAAHSKDMVQIIESIVIHWTRQIKDVVNNTDQSGKAEISGPLDEIDFWKGRAQDLLGIQEQIQVCYLSPPLPNFYFFLSFMSYFLFHVSSVGC